MLKNRLNIFLSIVLIVGGMSALFSSRAVADSLAIYYGGRLTQPSGAPVKGPVNLQASFYHSETGGSAVSGIIVNFNAVALTDGIFQVDISLTEEEWAQVFPAVGQKVYIQLENMTQTEVYPRQLYNVAPYALKVPVDDKTISYNTKGQLTLGTGVKLKAGATENYVELKADPASVDGTSYVFPAAPIANKFLTTDGSGVMSWIDLPGGGSITGVTAGTGLTGGGTTGAVTLNVDVGTTANKIVQLDGTGKLPVVDGSALTNVAASTITSQGTLATLNAVSGGAAGTITDNTITNADINGSAAIATSKISGPISSITGNGLGTSSTLNVGTGANNIPQLDGAGKLPALDGSALTNVVAATATTAGSITSQGALATANAVSGGTGGTITDDTITNADINAAAAIATTKLSGPVTSITGNGLGSSATLNVGVAANNVVQLDGTSKLPAVDGSALTNVTAGSISGQGALATLGAVSGGTGGTITDDTITNADVKSNAAIATSKLDGPVTSIANNGLGTAATQSVGAGAGNVVQLDGSGFLPALNGSAITSLNGSNIATGTVNSARIDWASPGSIGSTTPGTGSFTNLTSGNAGIKIKDNDGADHFVVLRAPDNMASDQVYKFPAFADSGKFLSTDILGNLSWSVPAGAGDMAKSVYDTNTNSIVDLAEGISGQGALATLGAVSGGTAGTITDDTITNADINASAAIATSKLSGAVTAISGNGLGALATAAAVSGGTGGTITDDTVTNADINASAAIATSKLAGAVTAISGNGLGALATAASVSGGTGGTITDDTITNADINASAAIATSKLSGAVTAISGNGLGALATAAAVSGGAGGTITDGTIALVDLSPTICAASQILKMDSSGTALTCAAETGGGASVTNGGQAGAVTVGSTNANTVNLVTTNLSRLSIAAAGGVGIGVAGDATAKLAVDGGILAAAGTSTGFKVSATTPAVPTGAIAGSKFNLTTTGAVGVNRNIYGISTVVGPGISGDNTVAAIFAENQATQDGAFFAGWGDRANFGVLGRSVGTSLGSNAGVTGQAFGGNFNYGVNGIATSDKAAGKNIGVWGQGHNTLNIGVGGLFTIGVLPSPAGVVNSAALIADNGTTSDPIFLARDNQVVVLSVLDGGGTRVGALSTPATAALVGTANLGVGYSANGTGMIVENRVANGTASGGSLLLMQNSGAAVGDTHQIGSLDFAGATTTSAIAKSASVSALAQGAFSVASAPTALSFSVTAVGSVTPSEKFRINANGTVYSENGGRHNNVLIGLTGGSMLEGGSGIVGSQLDLQNSLATPFLFQSGNGTTATDVFRFNARPAGVNENLFTVQKSGADVFQINNGGNLVLRNTGSAAREVRYLDNSNTFVGFKAPASLVGGDRTYVWPTALGSSSQVLTTDGSNNLVWANPGTGSVTAITAGTGLSGGTINTTGTINLANTVVTPGSYSRANITVDQQGRITTAASGNSVNLNSEVTGILPVANGGVGANLAATGGAGQYLKQSFVGGGVTVSTIAAADLPQLVGDSGGGGTKGAVPAPASGDAAAGKFLKADGTWVAPGGAGVAGSNKEIQFNNSGSFGAAANFVWDGSKLGIGTATPQWILHTAGDNADVNFESNSNTASNKIDILMDRSRGTTAVPSNVANGDEVGAVSFRGRVGASYVQTAKIQATVDGTVSAGNVPMRLGLFTSATNFAGLTERMSITPAGNVGIGTSAPAAKLEVSGGDFTVVNGDIAVQGGDAYVYAFASSTNQYSAGHFVLAHTSVIPTHQYYDIMIQKSTAGALTGTSSFEIRRRNSNGSELMTPFAITDAGDVALQAGYTAGSQVLGNVGVGTSSPTAKLHVTGLLAVTVPSILTPTGTAQTINWASGNNQVISLASATGTVVLAFSNAVAGASLGVKVIQGATARNFTWPAAVKWPGGVAPTISTANGAVDFITMFFDGTNYYGNYGQNYQ